MSDLAARLDAALADVQSGGASPTSLIPLYEAAAAQTDNETQRAFFLTHAYVHALESGDTKAQILKQCLQEMGREA